MKPASDWKGRIDVAIITVKTEEFEAVLDRFPKRETIDGIRHYEVDEVEALDGRRYSVAIARTLEQGQSEAQTVTEELIRDLEPRHIFLVGIAGGVPSPDYSLGDVVLASRVVAFLLSAIGPDGTTTNQITGGTMSREVRSTLANLTAWKKTRLKGWNSAESIGCDRPRVEVPLSKSDRRLYGPDDWRKDVIDSLARNHPASGREPKFLDGPAAAGNQLVKNVELVQKWQESARKLAQIDMELEGVWAAAQNHGIPLFSIRGVSDIIGFRREPEWTNYACHTAAAFAFHLIQAGVLPSIEPGPASPKPTPRDEPTGPAKATPTAVAAGPHEPTAEEPKEITSPTTGMVLVRVDAGDFDMGSGDDDTDAFDDEKPRHRVRITKPFYLGKYEVTLGQFRKFVGDAGYKTEGQRDGTGAFGWNVKKKEWAKAPKYSWRNPGFEQTDEHPVVCVSWNDAVAFCEWLGRKEGVTYRLPTEAEWEYACRAGSTTRYCFGDDAGKLGDFAWFDGNSGGTTHPVGEKPANNFGLYDMHGNVWEWCSDRYAADYYQHAPRVSLDPQGPSAETAPVRVYRGGGWFIVPRYCRSAARIRFGPANRYGDLGFRVARVQAGG
jgi:formylglycine-generating enzyme required for sulfatase activity/nucleoside phosphorylase